MCNKHLAVHSYRAIHLNKELLKGHSSPGLRDIFNLNFYMKYDWDDAIYYLFYHIPTNIFKGECSNFVSPPKSTDSNSYFSVGKLSNRHRDGSLDLINPFHTKLVLEQIVFAVTLSDKPYVTTSRHSWCSETTALC